MWKYFVNRIFWFIPSLFFLAVLSFFLSRSTGDDPVERMMGIEGIDELNQLKPAVRKREYQKISKQLGRDKALFYWSIVPHNYPENFSNLSNLQEKKLTQSWLKKGYRWDQILNFQNSVILLNREFLEQRDSLDNDLKNTWDQSLRTFKQEREIGKISNQLFFLKDKLSTDNVQHALLRAASEKVSESLINLQSKKNKFLFPSCRWHGFNNQFHQWLSGLMKGNFGISLADGRPATKRIMEAFYWTLFIVILAIFISLLLSIPAALVASMYKGRWIDSIISNLSYFLYAIPLFWLATLLVSFFTTEEYGSWTNIFPAVSSNYIGSAEGFWSKLGLFGKSLILPIFCMVVHSLAYLIKQMKASMANETGSFYVLTAKAKGISEWKIYLKHIFPNAIIPIITLIVDAFPAALAGSVIIEVIFNIPGMGRLMYISIFSADWNVVYGVLMLLGFITVVSYLIGDLMYSVLNPKIRFSKS